MFGKTFGVELEFIAPRGHDRRSIAAELTNAGVAAFDAGYTHATSAKWKLVSDLSVSGEGEAMELVSPILEGERGLADLRKACEVLTRIGCKANRTCGLHVHVGARSMSIQAMRRLAIMYSDFEDVIDACLPPSRRGAANNYLQPVKGANRNQILSANDAREMARVIHRHGNTMSERYRKLNFTAHWKHGTVEFRHHSGTTEADKACNWVSFCVRMVVAAERDEAAPVVTAAGTYSRPRQTALATIFDLVSRPNGCTREEARAALGRNTPPQMNRLTEDCGIPLRRVGQRYFLAEQPAVNSAANANEISLAGLCAKLGLPAAEASYWQTRQEYFAADTMADRVGWTPGSLMARRMGAG